MGGCVLELSERRVDHECVGHVLCHLWIDVVVREAAHEGRDKLLKGYESRQQIASTWTGTWGKKHALELAKRAVGLEDLAKSDKAAHLASEVDEVVAETIREKASPVSGY